jgi:hypothetical protein
MGLRAALLIPSRLLIGHQVREYVPDNVTHDRGVCASRHVERRTLEHCRKEGCQRLDPQARKTAFSYSSAASQP